MSQTEFTLLIAALRFLACHCLHEEIRRPPTGSGTDQGKKTSAGHFILTCVNGVQAICNPSCPHCLMLLSPTILLFPSRPSGMSVSSPNGPPNPIRCSFPPKHIQDSLIILTSTPTAKRKPQTNNTRLTTEGLMDNLEKEEDK